MIDVMLVFSVMMKGRGRHSAGEEKSRVLLTMTERFVAVLAWMAMGFALLSAGTIEGGSQPSVREVESNESWQAFVTTGHPDGLVFSCERVAAADDFLSIWRGYKAPTQCRLGVIAVGIPRSGSTVQVRLVSLFLGAMFGHDHVMGTYWDLHKHADVGDIAAHLTERDALFARVDSDTIFVTKTHEFKPQLLFAGGGLCQKRVVISTRRDLRLVAKSLYLSNMLPSFKVANVSRFLEASVNRNRCWRSYSSSFVEVDYEEFEADPALFLRRFSEAAGIEDHPAIAENIKIAVDRVMTKEGNPEIPATKSLALPEDISTAIQNVMRIPAIAKFQSSYRYSETEII